VRKAGSREQGTGAAASARCQARGCGALAEKGGRFCRRCAEEIDALDEMFFKKERDREVRELRAAFRSADRRERLERWRLRLKVSPREWMARTNWAFLVCACLWIGWELGAAFVAWMRAGQ